MIEPVSNFETNPGSFRGGRNIPPPAASMGVSPAAFQKFKAGKKAKGRAKAPPPADIIVPTNERLSKEDILGKTKAGHYRAIDTVERLRNQGKLDPQPNIAEGMFLAAEKLYAHFREGGLGGIKAQDLSRCAGGGDGGSSGFPKDEHALYHRQKFREALAVMGWYPEARFRGAGRLVVDVVCFGVTVKDAANVHVPSARAETVLAAGMDRLREGLFALAAHWGLYGSQQARIRAARDLLPSEAA